MNPAFSLRSSTLFSRSRAMAGAMSSSTMARGALTATVLSMAACRPLPLVLSRKHGSNRSWSLIFYGLGGWVGLTAYAMNRYAVGGLLKQSAVWIFDTVFLIELAWSYRLWLARSADARRWQIRAVVVLLGIATTRPVMGVFFATSRLTHLSRSNSLEWPSG
jgi:hypothetical protein